MELNKRHKIEKVCTPARDNRPVMENPYLREQNGRWELQATDSYKLVAIPVEVSEGDTEGAIPVSAVKGTDSVGKDGIRRIAANGSVSYASKSGGEVTLPRPDKGAFPNFDQLVPAYTHNGTHEFQIAFNAKMLYELAQALGDDQVVLTMQSPLRPIGVRPRSTDNDAYGLVMPVRIPARD